jgi:hypothetical protein
MMRNHLIEKKNEKVMMIQNRKKLQDRENKTKMEELDAKLMQRFSPDFLAAKKSNINPEDEILSEKSHREDETSKYKASSIQQKTDDYEIAK